MSENIDAWWKLFTMAYIQCIKMFYVQIIWQYLCISVNSVLFMKTSIQIASAVKMLLWYSKVSDNWTKHQRTNIYYNWIWNINDITIVLLNYLIIWCQRTKQFRSPTQYHLLHHAISWLTAVLDQLRHHLLTWWCWMIAETLTIMTRHGQMDW